jgi:glycosyltransferase involved in cell wall biosynthesis
VVNIQSAPTAYTTNGPKLMGRNAAGESFLRGFIKYSTLNEFWIQVEKKEHIQHFADTLRAFGRSEPIKAINHKNLKALDAPGVCYFPGPGIGESAWHRAFFGHDAWSLCGITHTTSSARAMTAISDLITAPLQPWDSLICTSSAVKDNVERLLQAQVDYMQDRLGITKLVLPQLPVIPLGIHTDDFAFTFDQKLQARQRIGVDSDTLVVLFMGRLSFHAKAHPLAMYQAIEAAAIKTSKKILLIECGWHDNKWIAKSFEEAARLACPSVQVVTLDGRNAEDRLTSWASADVFCSLSDNIQETFGIVPIEAMAAGLPVVVSDWDGYKDTVRDGVDGFRIPTIMPHSGLANDLAMRHALEIDTYDMYCGQASSFVGVDIELTTQAFVNLFKSSDLRRKMGQAGQQRAREVYDWRIIIPRYEKLWAKQLDMRNSSGGQLKKLTHPWPARMDPLSAFGSYPTQQLNKESLIVLSDQNPNDALDRVKSYRNLSMVNFAHYVLPTDDEVNQVLNAAINPSPAIELIAGFSDERKPFIFRSLTWLLKLGVIRVLKSASPL